MTTRGATATTRLAGLTLLLGTLLTIAAPWAAARIIHKERSVYQTILVTKDRHLVCLKFSVRREQRNQTCFDQRRPQHMVFSYTRMMMAALLFHPDPQRILIIGLGGGTLPMALAQLYPAAHMDIVEIDPAVVSVAQEYFDYKPNANMHTHEVDARVFTKRMVRRIERGGDQLRYDLVLLDAFNGEYIPEHLMTQQYFEETASVLSNDGIVVANTFAISKLYDHESVTFEAAFGPFLNIKLDETGNRVMLVGKRPLDLAQARSNLPAINPRLTRYDVDLSEYLDAMTYERDWDTDARVLTDQYSPANLLRRQRR